MRLSGLRTIDQVIEDHRAGDPEFRQMWDAQAFARQVAIAVVRYRAENSLTQRDLARMTDLRQETIGRLEAGERLPRLRTLVKLTTATDLTFHLDVAHGGVELVSRGRSNKDEKRT